MAVVVLHIQQHWKFEFCVSDHSSEIHHVKASEPYVCEEEHVSRGGCRETGGQSNTLHHICKSALLG